MRRRLWAVWLIWALMAACGGAGEGDEGRAAPVDGEDAGGSDGGPLEDAGPGQDVDAPEDVVEDSGVSEDSGPSFSDVLPDEPVAAPGYPLDDLIRFNHVQALGTHNSYHVEPAQTVDASHRYSHLPLDEQLELLGVRQFELDLHLNLNDRFEIFHLPAIDKETTCQTLNACLRVIKNWSDLRPGHMPLLVWLEPKDDVESRVAPEVLGYKAISGYYGALEDEILEVWPRERIFTPDDLRGGAQTLPEAIAAAGGWPTLGQLRQKIVFVMLDSGEARAEYLEGNPALEGRLLFVKAGSPDEPFAATFKMDNTEGDGDRIRELVEAGFLVTSNVDGATSEDAANQASFDNALETGSHFLASDFPGPVEGRGYRAQIPAGAPARCHPAVAPPECTPRDVEGFEPRQ